MVSFRQLVLIGVPLFALNTWAALPPTVLIDSSKRVSRKLQSVESSLDEINKSQENQFNNIDKTWREFAAYYKGNWAMEVCEGRAGEWGGFNVFKRSCYAAPAPGGSSHEGALYCHQPRGGSRGTHGPRNSQICLRGMPRWPARKWVPQKEIERTKSSAAALR